MGFGKKIRVDGRGSLDVSLIILRLEKRKKIKKTNILFKNFT